MLRLTTTPTTQTTATAPVVRMQLTSRSNLAVREQRNAHGLTVVDELPRDLAMAALRDASALGYRELVLEGGEPLLHRGLHDVLVRAQRHHLRTTLVTNGTLLHQARRLRGVLDLVERVSVELHGIGATHDEAVERDGAFDAATGNLALLRDHGASFGLRFALTSLNIDELPAVVDLAVAEGAAFLEVRSSWEGGLDDDAIWAAVAAIRTSAETRGVTVQTDLIDRDELMLFRGHYVPTPSQRNLAAIAPTLIILPTGRVLPLTTDLPAGLAVARCTRRGCRHSRPRGCAPIARARWRAPATARGGRRCRRMPRRRRAGPTSCSCTSRRRHAPQSRRAHSSPSQAQARVEPEGGVAGRPGGTAALSGSGRHAELGLEEVGPVLAQPGDPLVEEPLTRAVLSRGALPDVVDVRAAHVVAVARPFEVPADHVVPEPVGVRKAADRVEDLVPDPGRDRDDHVGLEHATLAVEADPAQLAAVRGPHVLRPLDVVAASPDEAGRRPIDLVGQRDIGEQQLEGVRQEHTVVAEHEELVRIGVAGSEVPRGARRADPLLLLHKPDVRVVREVLRLLAAVPSEDHVDLRGVGSDRRERDAHVAPARLGVAVAHAGGRNEMLSEGAVMGSVLVRRRG